MGCLNIDIRKLGEAITPNVTKLNEALTLDTTKLGSLSVSASLYGKYLSLLVSEIGHHLNLSCGVVCSVSDDIYLRVSPSEVQWITDDIGVIFTVRSNAEWEVLIDGKDAEDDTVLYRLQNSMLIANNTLLQNKSEVITQLTNMDSIVNDTKMRNYEI